MKEENILNNEDCVENERNGNDLKISNWRDMTIKNINFFWARLAHFNFL